MSIVTRNISKSFGEPPTHVLKNLTFEIADGDFVCISGRSGSGKSTLLYVISSLDSTTRGEVLIDNHLVTSMSENEIHQFRNLNMGFVFQFHYLLPDLTALENVLMPAYKTKRAKIKEKDAREWLAKFDLADKAHRRPSQLSGGEQQRVAIARSLVMNPKYLFADEPTGNLDTYNSDVVFKIFQEVNREQKTTVVFVTHDPDYAALARTQIHLVDGTISEIKRLQP